MLQDDLTPAQQMKRARIQLYRESPFFGYLVQYLKLVETENVPTCAISEKGQLFFNPEFVDEMTEDEVRGVLAHEVMHKAMKGFARKGNRDGHKWNVAQDLVINYVLAHENDFELPEEGLLPDEDGVYRFEQGDFEDIENIDENNFEQVYDKVPKDMDGGHDGHVYGDGDGEGGSGGEDGDQQGDGAGDSEAGMPDQDIQGSDISEVDDDVDWEARVAQAQEHAASQGKEPGGLEDMLNVAERGDVDYQRLISQTISSLVPSDFTYTSPSKSSRAIGEYLPSVKTEKGLDVIVAMDTSGSVSDQLLVRFFGEIKNLVNTFESVKLTVIQHDSAVQRVDEYTNPKESDFDTVEIAGRGGTSHVPVFEEIEENNHQREGPSVFIGLTDGYTTVPEDIPAFNEVIWVINNHTIELDRLKHGQIARIEPPPGEA